MAMRILKAEMAASLIKSGNKIFIQTAAAAPQKLIKALVDRADELQDITIYQMHTEGPAPYGDPGMEKTFTVNCFFVGSNLRKAVQDGRANYIPVFLSEIPGLFRKKIISVDCALIHVSPPDAHGYCSLGVSVDIAPAVLENTPCIIAQVNPKMPRTYGDTMIHVSRLNALVEADDNIHEIELAIPDEVTTKIGAQVASLVEDGSTLQMGIGSIPNAVLARLGNYKKLGIHTEMFSDGIIDLVEKGVITGELKRKRKNKIVSSFLLGSKKLYQFVHENPIVEMLDVGYVNDVAIIRQNQKVMAINSAIEVDLTGQVCADSIGQKIYSGVGGQIDFMRGAAYSEGGKPIIALPSVTAKGESKIVSTLKIGAGVVTTRANVHYVITEYGIAHLYGKNLKQRARALIDIAHPDQREKLEAQASPLLQTNQHYFQR
jgi:acyl-CoA hydrolase